MKCLIGEKSNKVAPYFRKGIITLDESNANYFYLCRFVYPWNWANNFHCVKKKQRGNPLRIFLEILKFTL